MRTHFNAKGIKVLAVLICFISSLTVSSSWAIVSETDEFPVSAIIDTNKAVDEVNLLAGKGTSVGFTAFAEDDDPGTKITYKLTDSAGGMFSINPANGVIRVNGTLSEGNQSITILATSSDGGSSTLTTSINVFSDGVLRITSSAKPKMPENTTDVIKVTAEDPAGGSFSFSISGGKDSSFFSIDSSSGDLTFKSAPDFEDPKDDKGKNQYQVEVKVNNGSTTATQAVVVAVTNVIEISAVIDTDKDKNTVSEDAAIGTEVQITGFATAFDSNETITYKLSDSAKGLFSIDSSTGIVTVDGALDFETAESNKITIQAVSSTGDANTAKFTITILDVAEVVIQTSAAPKVPENQTAVITVRADDPAKSGITYTITGGKDASFFTLHPSTGVLVFKVAPDFEDPQDDKGKNKYAIEITASNGIMSDTQLMVVSVTNIIEISPVIDTDAVANTALETALPGTPVNLTGFATAFDSNETISYSLKNSAGGLFQIDASTGIVTVKGTLDFETNPNPKITVQANSTTGDSALKDFVISLGDVLELGITSDPTPTVNEGETAVLTVTAIDPLGLPITFAITGGADAANFAIDPVTGELVFKVPQDFENPTDSKGKNKHTIEITIDNGTDTFTQVIVVTVVNVPEITPVIDIDLADNTVNENAPIGTPVLITASATASGAGDLVFYDLTNDAKGLFSIDDKTGIVTVAGTVVFNKKKPNLTITVRASSTAGDISTAKFTIPVVVVAKIPPVITSPSKVNVKENFTAVITVTATSEVDNPLVFSISGGKDKKFFAIDSATGALTFISAPDFETPLDDKKDNKYELTVSVSNGSGVATQKMAVTIKDLDETPLTPLAKDDHYSKISALVINEDSGELIFDVTANDFLGNEPLKVISVGQVIIDSQGNSHGWRSTSRLADPGDTSDLTITMNGEVSCAHLDCISGETQSSQSTGVGLADGYIIYQPGLNFQGVDSFTYCVADSDPTDEPPFTPPSDVRCATVTINVVAVNDKPTATAQVVYATDVNVDLVVSTEDGLRSFVRDLDNTNIDGFGCDPLSPSCTPGAGDPQADQLVFNIDATSLLHGVLFDTSNPNDGAFSYRPDAGFTGIDQLSYEVCDAGGLCASGIIVILIGDVEPPPIPGDDVVEFDFGLADSPLELPVGPEHNVLLINDNSGSMRWDIMSENESGLYFLSTGDDVRYTNKATAKSSLKIAPGEFANPDEGFWRLRNPIYNTVYYSPDVLYKPWEGLDANDVAFPPSNPVDARHDPTNNSPTKRTDLTTPITYNGWGVKKGLTTNIETKNFLIPRYYKWQDLDLDGKLDAVPSPAMEPAICELSRTKANKCAEGILVEIKSSTTSYDRHANRKDCITSVTSCTYDEELQNFANWFTYYRTRELTAKAALGLVVSVATNIRIGFGVINVPAGDISGLRRITSMNSSVKTGAKAAMIDAIYGTFPSGDTPLRQSLRDAGRHFSCKADDIFQSTGDSLPGDADCPVQAAPVGNCQQNYALLITDGEWTGGSPGALIGNADNDNSSNFDEGAFAGTISETLADVAMHYYERDLHLGLGNEVPTTARDRELAANSAFEDGSDLLMHQHMTTYTVGFGVSGHLSVSPSDFVLPFPWGDPLADGKAKIDDLRHAAYNGRGLYLDAADGGQLAIKLLEAFEEFSQGSGAASAVSFNSQEVRQDSLVFRAFYNTKLNTGDLIAQKLTATGFQSEPIWSTAEALDLVSANSRQIITWDADSSTGIPFRGPLNCGAGCLNTAQQEVFISDPTASLSDKNLEVTEKVNYLRGDRSKERPAGSFRERPAINGILGDIIHSTPVFVGPPNRGSRDSEPFPQSNLYSQFRLDNTGRKGVIYVAANDGMLHGVDAADGKELFGFIPNNLMLDPFSQPITNLLKFTYTHKFFVDLSPALEDVYMDADDDGDKEWTSLLVGGHGAGAKAYFALNVTDPTRFAEVHADEIVLWEFTAADDSYPTDASGTALVNTSGTQRLDLQSTPQPVKDLGYSFSVPTLAMSNVKDSDGEQEWVSLFGNGYNSTAGIAKLFVLFIDRGVDGTWCHPDMRHNVVLDGVLPSECVGKQDFVKIDTGIGVKDGFPNGLGTPRGIDIDGNGTIDYAYAGDTFGNFYRFNLTSDNFNDWSVTKIFKAEYEDTSGFRTEQPITVRPIVTFHPTEDDFLVLFATGSYIRDFDGTDNSIQSLYGLWDRLTDDLIDIDDLVQQRYINKSDADFGFVRVLTDNEVNYSTTGGKKGWYNHLDSVAVGQLQGISNPEFPGEKAIRNIQLRGGLAFVNTIIPRSNTSCIDVAGGFSLSFCPGTGGSNCQGDEAIFDLNNDGVFDHNDNLLGQVVSGIRFDEAVPADSTFIGDTRVTQLSDKSLDIIRTNTNRGLNTGRLSWKQINSID